MKTMLDRRWFGKKIGLATLAGTVPAFVQKSALALDANPAKNDRVLVIIQLGGGNDSLNTLVPLEDDLYRRARPTLAVPKDLAIKLDDRLGLHPEMVEMARLFKEGGLGVITNVGYPNPNRSHFRSTDIWESGSSSDQILKSGWIGRFFDACCSGVPANPLGVRLGEQPSLALAGNTLRTATFSNPKILERTEKGNLLDEVEKLVGFENTGLEALDFVQRTANQSLDLSRQLARSVRDFTPKVDYPPFALCQSLRLVAQMIASGMAPRVYYVSHGGFDTHAAQAQKQAYLLQELSQAIGLFHQDLKTQGLLDRVLGFTFSEFGRRVAENKNAGTDHGSAGIMLTFGGKIKPGILGLPPDLANLDSLGDLGHQVDFRQVYAGIIRDWFNADPAAVLPKTIQPFSLVA